MNIYVCVRQALDWNASTKDFRIDADTNDVMISFARYRIDQFDDIALEVGLQYRERHGGEVRALTVGTEESDDVLRHALARKADKALLIDRRGLDVNAAQLLAATVQSHGAGIILCGRTSSLGGSGCTGPTVAELLRIPFLANVIQIDQVDGACLCRCETVNGYEVLKVSEPFVASVTNAESNLPRTPSIKDAMRAHRLPIEMLAGNELMAVSGQKDLQRLRLLKRYIPTMSRSCKRIDGEPHEQARVLADYIRSVSH